MQLGITLKLGAGNPVEHRQGAGGRAPRLLAGLGRRGLRHRRGDADHLGAGADDEDQGRHRHHADAGPHADLCRDDGDDLADDVGQPLPCGIGPSGPQVIEGWHGVAFGKPLARTKEYIAIIRQILRSRGAADLPRRALSNSLRGAGCDRLGQAAQEHVHGDPSMPIYTASITPAGLRTAGEVADGTLPIFFSPGSRTSSPTRSRRA